MAATVASLSIDDRHAEALLQQVAQRHVAQRQVHRLDDAPGGEVDHRGDADADALDPPGAVLEVGDAGHDAVQAGLRASWRR